MIPGSSEITSTHRKQQMLLANHLCWMSAQAQYWNHIVSMFCIYWVGIILMLLIYWADVWGFDEDAVKALKSMEAPDEEKDLIQKYAILLNQDSELLQDCKINVIILGHDIVYIRTHVSATRSCGSLPQPTTLSNWKLLIFV